MQPSNTPSNSPSEKPIAPVPATETQDAVVERAKVEEDTKTKLAALMESMGKNVA